MCNLNELWKIKFFFGIVVIYYPLLLVHVPAYRPFKCLSLFPGFHVEYLNDKNCNTLLIECW